MKERLRFVSFRLDRLPSGECSARVTLAWPQGGRFEGEARGLASQAGELRCAAQACLLALSQAVKDPAFELVGVKAVRAARAAPLGASFSTRHDPTTRGASECPGRPSDTMITEESKARTALTPTSSKAGSLTAWDSARRQACAAQRSSPAWEARPRASPSKRPPCGHASVTRALHSPLGSRSSRKLTKRSRSFIEGYLPPP